MNPHPDDPSLEKLLSAQSLRPLPPEWRDLILPPAAARRPLRAVRWQWAAVAACWVATAAFHLATPVAPPASHAAIPPPANTAELLAALRLPDRLSFP